MNGAATATRFDALIIGGGHAGAQAAIGLAQMNFAGSIGIVSDEPYLPYERPPLSKDYLAGEKPFERLLIRTEGFWAERGISVLHGAPVVEVRPDRRVVVRADGGVIAYGKLIWAAGAAARRLTLPGSELAGIHSIRTRADVDALTADLARGARVVVVGGGYIGLEAAAVLTKLGKRVVVLEAADRVLARVAGEPLSRFFEAEHRAHGVDVRLGVAIAALEGEGEGEGARVSAVRLADGEAIPADIVIVGIGITPNVAPMLGAGAQGGNGVVVDGFCQTSLPDIFAIGDCAAHVNRFAGGATIRLESVQNANDQAMTVARFLTSDAPDSATAYDAVPWFWSNQYDLKLQTIGLSTGYDRVVTRGNPADRAFSVVYLKAGRVVALDCVNMVKDYVQGKALVLAGAVVDPVVLADLEVPLKQPIMRLP